VKLVLIVSGVSGVDGLEVTLDNFAVNESRRLYSDSTLNIDRMRSVDSFNTISTHYPSLQMSETSGRWSVEWEDGEAAARCTLLFTPQPVSDDCGRVECKFVVSVRQHSKVSIVNDSFNTNLDPLISHYISNILYNGDDNEDYIVKTKTIGTVEHVITLDCPIRICKSVSPLTSSSCKFKVEVETIDEDAITVTGMSLAVYPVGPLTESLFKCELNSSLPCSLDALVGSTFDWTIHKLPQVPINAQQFKSKLEITAEAAPSRPCRLSFESPFDVAASFLPAHSDDFTVEFRCDERRVILDTTFWVTITITNRTLHEVDVTFKFPLPEQPVLPTTKASNVKLEDMSDEAILSFIRETYKAAGPGIICTEAERRVGPIPPGSMHVTKFEFFAVALGKHSLPLVQMTENGTGRTVDFGCTLDFTITGL
jgi:hypothetical protein